MVESLIEQYVVPAVAIVISSILIYIAKKIGLFFDSKISEIDKDKAKTIQESITLAYNMVTNITHKAVTSAMQTDVADAKSETGKLETVDARKIKNNVISNVKGNLPNDIQILFRNNGIDLHSLIGTTIESLLTQIKGQK